MKKRNTLKIVVAALAAVVLILSLTMNLALLFANPTVPDENRPVATSRAAISVEKTGDEELGYLLVKLMLETRREIAGHFTRKQSPIPAVSKLYQRFMVKNLILPAAVADQIFAETVPHATGGRAWVKMVVDNPRNPHNRADEVAAGLLAKLRAGAATAEQPTADAYYYAEPIKAKAACMYCHGEPKGSPDPFFPEYTRDGWREGEVIGAVVARVGRQEPAGS
ncbi:MAG: DUF3365 domain-containing protein [Planctomycetes bacterium]|nr:DUF3365 domain-containing protein [Planctomycetota bacterium]